MAKTSELVRIGRGQTRDGAALQAVEDLRVVDWRAERFIEPLRICVVRIRLPLDPTALGLRGNLA